MTNTSMTDFTLLSAKEYIKDLTHCVRQAKSRIYIMDLIIADDEATHELISAIEKAVKQGIKVDLAADTFTYGELGGFFSPFKRRAAKSQAVTAMTKRFIEAGASFRWLGGDYKINPFAGVTHIKWCIVDDTVYCFGGTNLFKEGIESLDYMFKTTDPELANDIIREHLHIISADASPESYDGFHKTYPYGRLLVDSGKRGDSLIYKRACVLAKNAHKILFVSQYCPSGELAQHLKQTQSDIYFNRPELATTLHRLLITTTMSVTNIKTIYKKDRYIHAKFMLFEMPNGKRIALTGSHNFSYSGVRLGTREVALESEDAHIYKQLEDFWRQNIK
ncbi:MAG: phosphatidylserine/phosphatidylglycerophosphate/cardiolipin synthase family protein [Gammaproteobacteria bacterium]|nr:MAG: phosphatidylserine/phosphatidylglycerophosphate/cardiolipin synthase family protein [Gammaproteobacteria bacterium]